MRRLPIHFLTEIRLSGIPRGAITLCGLTAALLCGISVNGQIAGAPMPSTLEDGGFTAADSPEYRIPPTHHWNIRSSVQVSRDTLREAYIASREAYTKKLQKYAKCTPQDAEKAVKAAHPGMKIGNLQLRNIRTNLVYMAVVEDDEDKFLVIVDAGNCKVLLDRPIPTHHERVFAEPY